MERTMVDEIFDIEFWRSKDFYNPTDAAYLWLNKQPVVNPRKEHETRDVLVSYEDLMNNVATTIKNESSYTTISLIHGYEFGDTTSPWGYLREHLISYANMRQVKPLFLFNDTSSTEQNKKNAPHGNIEANSKKREEILGAALFVLANFREDCIDSNGKVVATKTRSLIESKWEQCPSDIKSPPLATGGIEKLIGKWIKN